jgi:hypothetical protein
VIVDPIVMFLAACLITGPGLPYAAVTRRLAVVHGEQRVETAYLHRRAVAELWLNPDTGSFTIIARSPQDRTCQALAGTVPAGCTFCPQVAA